MTETTLQVAAIQPFVPANETETEEMHKSAWNLVQRAAEEGARLMLLPEFFNVMGMPAKRAVQAAGDTEAFRSKAADLCRQNNAWLLLPLVERRGNHTFNTAHLFNPAGKIAFTYDKTHLTITERQEYGLTPGERIETIQTDLGRIGVMICYDVYFPEVARVLALQEVDIILFPSLQRSDTEDRCMVLNRARAIDSQAHLIRSSFGQRRNKPYLPGMMYGASCVIGPDGAVLASAGRHEGIAAATIYPKRPWLRPRCGGVGPQPVRTFLHEDRRPELYKIVVREKKE
jgi:predicted amidohydrolase